MIGKVISHYRILEPLGEGGMGSVYVAEDTHLGRHVAIKFPAVTEDEHHYRARFLREARAVSMLNHANIATIYDYGETDAGQPFIVMELVKGPTLSDLLHEHGLTIKRAVGIIEAVGEALSEAHSKGIIHRDIKPTNVVISERNVPKVLDFGLAKETEEHRHVSDPDARTLLATKTRSGVVVGTPLYLSPEQATGAAVDARSDIFALGALLYECIAGRPAFDGDTVIEIVAQVIQREPPPPSTFNRHITPELDRITLKALQKKPDARYQSVDEMLADLYRVNATLEDNGHTLTQRIAPSHGTARVSALNTISDIIQRPRLSIGAVVFGLLALGLIVWGVVHWLRPPPHQPTAEAKRWYETGINALRDGAYYQASKALERAIAADDDYALAHASLAEALMELDFQDRAKDEMLRVATLTSKGVSLTKQDSLYIDAITASVRRDFPSAIKSYLEIEKLMPNQAHVYVDLGRAYENSEKTKDAIDSYIKATNLDQQYATPFLRVGILYGRQQELASAKGGFDRAEEIYQALGNFEGRAEVAFQRGALSVRLGKMEEANAQLQKALELSKAANNLPQQIKTLLQLVYVYQSTGKPEEAEQVAGDAVNLAQANGMENLTVRGLVDLGTVFFTRNDYSQAEKYFQQAHYLARRYKAQRNEARAAFMIGNLRIAQGKADEGVSYVEQALAFYEKGNFRQEASRALTLLARAKRLKADYEGALRALEKLLQLAEQVDDPAQRALSHEGMGFVLIRQEQYTQALDHFKQNYLINKSLNNQAGMGDGLLNQSGVLWRLGRADEARARLAEALPIANQLKSDSLLAEIHLINAEMALAERLLHEAKTEAQLALTQAGTRPTGIEARRVLCLAQVFSGAKGEGKAACEEAARLATAGGDPWFILRMKLALAEAMLESGEAQSALPLALQLQEEFARLGQPASEWRAWLIAARSSLQAGDKESAQKYAKSASETLAGLEQKWGNETYSGYLGRGDVQFSQKQLRELLAAGS